MHHVFTFVSKVAKDRLFARDLKSSRGLGSPMQRSCSYKKKCCTARQISSTLDRNDVVKKFLMIYTCVTYTGEYDSRCSSFQFLQSRHLFVPHEFVNLFSLVVVEIELLRRKVIRHFGRCIDLDTTHDRNHSRICHIRSSCCHNTRH